MYLMSMAVRSRKYSLCTEIYVVHGNLFIVHGNLFTVWKFIHCEWKLMCCAEIFSSPRKFFGLCMEIIMSHVWIFAASAL